MWRVLFLWLNSQCGLILKPYTMLGKLMVNSKEGRLGSQSLAEVTADFSAMCCVFGLRQTALPA